ncbi:hypothetical protein H5410_033244 [Solanum commersonii]|uniref:Ionotropic glutamate receptor C-terminal domain-containing protein n=1 Tax=Solanum commersonii TaxID=4109 RepID=A0A9J5YN42_SOLCO|nr:hypothetical protein H5410_033244 [Solanum commersonii]
MTHIAANIIATHLNRALQEMAFPKGSPLVPDVSRAVLKVMEGDMDNIIQKWFGNETDCPQKDIMDITFDSLALDSFKGLFLIAGVSAGEDNKTSVAKVDVGIILDLETDLGKVMHISILLALDDYHATASRSAIRIVPHLRDSKKDDVEAASAVQAIFGPQMSTQTDFVIDLGNRVKVPIISPATSPLLTVKENPFFIRGALPSSSQTKAIAAIVKNFDWKEVVVIYEDSSFGTGIVPHLTDALLEISTSVFYRSKFDAIIGDITISANRSKYVDFTLPFTESGYSAVVPVKDDDRKNAWIFVKPLKSELWVTTGAFFVFIGFVVWVLEHRVNKEFRGPKRDQVGMIFWFSFSTLVFAHKERVTSNFTRFVLIVWVFVVLVLTSSYTASLTSMLTAQKIQPTITDLNDLIKRGEYVGYQKGSFVRGVLKSMKFDSTKFRSYSTLEEYNDALSRGSKNGGVGAIVDELPYLRLFLNKYCRKYIMVGPTYKTAGFGFTTYYQSFQMKNPRCHFLILFLQLVSIISFCHYVMPIRGEDNNTSAVKVDLGIILDMETDVGKVMHTCILLAIEDYHAVASHTATRIVLHLRDSEKDDVEAASAAIYLLKDVQVQAIFGPQMSTQTDFVIDLGNRAKVPIISPATSPSLSVKENPFFIRGALPSSSQTKAIAAIVKNYNWTKVVIIHEDSSIGTGIVPHLTDALLEINTLVPYKSAISPSASDDQILKELYNLNAKQTVVFIVHLQPYLASRLFLKAKEAGMMRSGYAWIITDVLTSFLDSVDHSVIESSMQGVLGIKPYVPRSNELDMFTKRWRKRFSQEYPDMDPVELNVFGLWAYDGITALTKAVEKVGGTAIPKFKKADTRKNLTDLDTLGTSELGSLLIHSMQNTTLKTGLSGDFCLANGELHPSPYQIVNIIGTGQRSVGFWTEKDGISYKLKMNGETAKTNNKQLGAIIWPGESIIVPRGREVFTSGKKLRVGVPVSGQTNELFIIKRDSKTQAQVAAGLCVDFFNEVIQYLPYSVPYEFIPILKPDSPTSPDYDHLYFTEYDAVIESGIATVVPVKDDDRKNIWIFLKPLKSELWITTGAFFVFIGFVVWVLEHRVNKEFRGPKHKQVGMIFWFSFSTLVFAHRERVTSNLTRFVLIVWVFVVMVLTSSYTASLTSMLTVQQLKPTITNLNDLIKNGEYVGYQEGSFVVNFLLHMQFDSSKLRSYSTLEEYNDALSRGSKNGGVAAIIDELPYLTLFLNKYCRKYIMVGQPYKTKDIGLAFPKDSHLVPDVSTAVLKVNEGGEFTKNGIQKYSRNDTDCPQNDGTSESLTLDSFKGLFLIAGVSAGSALLIFFFIFLYQNREILATDDSIQKRLAAIAKVFDEEKDNSNSKSEKPEANEESQTSTILFVASEASPEISPDLPLQSLEIRISDGLGASPADEGFSITEPATSANETITETF